MDRGSEPSRKMTPTSILSRKFAFALLAMLGVLLVFFFPVRFGPLSVTHGPATVFRALAAARGMFAAMRMALLMAFLCSASRLKYRAAFSGPIQGAPGSFALRC